MTLVRVTHEPKVGDTVLIGRPGTSMPGGWWVARVLWVGRDDILTQHTPAGGSTQRHIFEIEYVRAVGEIGELVKFKEACRKRLRPLTDHVRECEGQLDQAREAVWAELDKIAAEAKQ